MRSIESHVRSFVRTSDILDFVMSIKEKGFFHIFFADIVNKFVSFFTVFALVRILSKQTYGEWSYALNIVSIILLFQGMGSVSALLQYCSEAQNTSQLYSYYKFGVRIGLISNTGTGSGHDVYRLVYPVACCRQ